MPDGSYPLTGCAGKDSVESAAKLAHHSKTYSFDQVKAHVMAGMKKFNCPDSVLPESWGAGDSQAKSAEPIPRDVLFRALAEAPQLRAAAEGGMPTLAIRFAVFNQWTEIDSIFEGRFLEQLAPGTFAKTIQENQARMRVLFQHGKDPQIGNKPLGPIRDLAEDGEGAAANVPLLDTSYNRDLIPGLEAGLYGASFRFRVTREDVDNAPERSQFNPDGIPERTIREVQLQEFGPVTFGAYAGASSGLRSVTDEFIFGQYLLSDPNRLRELVASLPAPAIAPPTPGAEAEPHPSEGRRDDPPEGTVPDEQPVGLPVFRNPNKRRH